MKLLTFLGVGKYHQTTYLWQGQEYTTRFAPAASAHFLKPDTLIPFLTEDAEEQVFPAMLAALPSKLAVQPVPVSLGRNEQELWQIFEQVSSSVFAGEEVSFDITHGLRSFPLIGLLAAAFLRSGLNIRLKAVLYGAFEVRDQSVTPNRTAMFDLTPMINLLEWASAADRFNHTGDSRYLASLVKAQQKALALESQDDRAALAQVGDLSNLAGALTGISQSLRLIRPHQAMEQIAGLKARVEKAQPALARAAAARPFSLLLENIVHSYEPLAQSEPLAAKNISRTLEVELMMIHWYFDREQWVQAVSLAREWLVSWIMVHLGMQRLTSLGDRHRIEGVVGSEAQEFRASKSKEEPFHSVFLAQIPEVEQVLSLWLALTDVRNDIDHAGMREQPGEPKNLIKQIEKYLQVMDDLPAP